jgi:hypothetical protein
MFYDPWYDFLSDIGFDWWSIWVFYAIFSNFVDLLFLNIFRKERYGGPQRYKSYLKNPINWLLWPILIMGSSAAIYLITGRTTNSIVNNISNLSVEVNGLAPEVLDSNSIALLCLVFSGVISTFTLLRHFRETELFFTKPRLFGIVRTLFFDFPLAYMLSSSSLKFIYQVILLNRFYRSNWLPDEFLTPDNFWGLEWAHKLLIIQITLGVLISIAPLILLARDDIAEKHSKQYLFAPFAFITTISVFLIALFINLNSMLGRIHNHFYTTAVEQRLLYDHASSSEDMFHSIIAYQDIELITRLPDSVSLPLILEGSIGTSFVVWAGILINTLSDRFLEKIIQRIKKLIMPDTTGKIII